MTASLTIFPATARFLIALAGAHLYALMMRTVPAPIDSSAASCLITERYR
jgi:hypothetical protein